MPALDAPNVVLQISTALARVATANAEARGAQLSQRVKELEEENVRLITELDEKDAETEKAVAAAVKEERARSRKRRR